MKSCKTGTLTTYTILLLAVGLLLGCKPLVEPKEPHPAKQSKEVVTEPAQSVATIAEPITSIDEVESIESLESGLETPADVDSESAEDGAAADIVVATNEDQAKVVDDGADVVKATPAIMRKVQQALVDAGLNPGPVDGVSGARTVAAIESFQKQNNIPAGKLTKETLRALGVDF
ncbi:MAG: peptidoglycan-binding domain-containing protein [Pseudomonadota bacterium]